MDFPTYPTTTKIAQDTFILEMIFNRFDNGLMSNLHIRSVCKKWNRTCLKLVEKEHRRIDIRLVCGKHTNQYVYVNYKPVQRPLLQAYFEFLTFLAGVQVEEVNLVRGFELGMKKDKEFHDTILEELIKEGKKLKKLTGLTEICKCCEHCLKLSKTCQEFGPISKIKRIIVFKQPKHFERLIVDDMFIEAIANYCVNNSRSRAQCAEVMNKILPKMNITCSKLVICIEETRIARATLFERDTMLLPRPVLDAIMKHWKVETVVIKPIFDGFQPRHNDEWSLSGYFTALRINGLYTAFEWVRDSVKIGHVHVDLTESFHCAKDLGSHLPGRDEHRGFENLVANIIKMFKSDEISINFAAHHFDRAFVENIFRVSRFGAHTNLKLNIEMMANNLNAVKEKVILPDDLEKYQMMDPPNPLYIKAIGSDPKRFKTKRYIGTRCKFVDSLRNLRVNVNVFTHAHK